MERAAFNQITDCLSNNNFTEEFQFQSSGQITALSQPSQKLLVISGSIVMLLLDVSAAFDTVDHSIRIERLENLVGLSWSVLNWFLSYVSGIKFFVTMDDCVSGKCEIPLVSLIEAALVTYFFVIYASSRRRYQKP